MLHYNTVNELLKDTLMVLIGAAEFNQFRLVGGTALSLQVGHRKSIDIDLFSDAAYDSIDFKEIENFLQNNFSYVGHFASQQMTMGKSYSIGTGKQVAVKLDLFYTDAFIQPARVEDGIRMATIEEIIAMKIDIVQRGGRKKDFWDLHELMTHFTIRKMLDLHQQRYEYSHDEQLILQNLTNFGIADSDFDPFCLRGKYWEFIKEDIEDAVIKLLKSK